MQVQLMDVHGIATVRFQPYRLVASKCYDPDDVRISCLACHNPHKNLDTKPAAYDLKCLACHRSSSAPSKTTHAAVSTSTTAAARVKAWAPACRVGKRLCVTCHMPKYSLPGAHFKFTDHRVRVARRGAPYLE
jgi:hypothetical protein